MSAFLLLTVLAIAIFTMEFTVMFILPFHYEWQEALLDSTLLVTLLFPLLYFIVFKRTRSQMTRLSTVKTELETQVVETKRAEKALKESEKQLRYLSSQLLTTQEKERKRISRELHDELMQALALLKLRVGLIENRLKDDQVLLMRECESLTQYIDGMIENVRRLSRDLSPFILEDLGLSAALQWLVSNLANNYKVETSIDVPRLDHLFPQESQIMIYRVFQEALTNMVKHAQATHLSICIKCEDSSISFSLEDDGKGFDLGRVIAKGAGDRGLGLVTMDERIKMLGGALNIQSQEAKGTRLSFSIPMKQA